MKGFPRQINSWSELVNFLHTCCSAGLSKKAEDSRLRFISYKTLKGPGKGKYNFGFVCYFSIYKPPEKYVLKFIEVTLYGVQQLTQEEYDAFPQIRDALMHYAEMSGEGRFPDEINDWPTLVSICNRNGANLLQTKIDQVIRFVSYEEKSGPDGSYYILRLETRIPYRETKEIRPF